MRQTVHNYRTTTPRVVYLRDVPFFWETKRAESPRHTVTKHSTPYTQSTLDSLNPAHLVRVTSQTRASSQVPITLLVSQYWKLLCYHPTVRLVPYISNEHNCFPDRVQHTVDSLPICLLARLKTHPRPRSCNRTTFFPVSADSSHAITTSR